MIVTFVVNSLWQGLIVVAVTALLLRLVPSRDAATRYAAWFLALAALAAIPALTSWTHFGSALAAAFAHNAASRTGTYSLVFAGTVASGAANPNFEFAVAALWIAGAVVGLGRLALSLYRIASLVSGAVPHSSVEGVRILTSRSLSIPIATGLSSPAIVLPAELANALDPADLRCTIEHELAHVRRGDVLANALQRIVEAIFFWNPWVQLAGRRLSSEREAACDDRAALRIGEPREYAVCLAALGQRIAERGAPLLTPGAFGSRNSLVARIERLTGGGAPGNAQINYLALGGIFMLFAALTLVFQALVPAPAHAAPLQAPQNTLVASGCSNPDVEPGVVNAVAPQLSRPPAQKTSVQVAVTIGPNGRVVGAKVFRSSGDIAVDNAVLTAAEKSTYSPKLVNCRPVQGTYLFKADVAP